MAEIKDILGALRKTDEQFSLIAPGDKIAVGISGGKDSMLLALALCEYKRYIKPDFEIVGITVDLGFDGFDTDKIGEFVTGLGVEYHAVKTEIAKIVFDIRREENPCALCSKFRKGALYSKAVELGCNKAAFAHHADDLAQTLLMSIIYQGKLAVFTPVTHLTRSGITLIRPFILLEENKIIGAVNKNKVPCYKNPCPADKDTKRAEIKGLIRQLIKDNPAAKDNILAAITNTKNYNLW